MEIAKKIVASTEEIFSTMIFMDLSASEPMTEGHENLNCHVSSMIGMSGDITSMLGVHCPGNVGKALTSEMLGMDVEEIDTDVKDTLGEIANMVAGGLKAAFAAENINLELSIPTTIAGKSYTVASPTESNKVIIPFDVESGRFFVELKYSLN